MLIEICTEYTPKLAFAMCEAKYLMAPVLDMELSELGLTREDVTSWSGDIVDRGDYHEIVMRLNVGGH